jgi:hypothetical protein
MARPLSLGDEDLDAIQNPCEAEFEIVLGFVEASRLPDRGHRRESLDVVMSSQNSVRSDHHCPSLTPVSSTT